MYRSWWRTISWWKHKEREQWKNGKLYIYFLIAVVHIMKSALCTVLHVYVNPDDLSFNRISYFRYYTTLQNAVLSGRHTKTLACNNWSSDSNFAIEINVKCELAFPSPSHNASDESKKINIMKNNIQQKCKMWYQKYFVGRKCEKKKVYNSFTHTQDIWTFTAIFHPLDYFHIRYYAALPQSSVLILIPSVCSAISNVIRLHSTPGYDIVVYGLNIHQKALRRLKGISWRKNPTEVNSWENCW